MKIAYTIDKAALDALARAPTVMDKHLEVALGRAAQETAKEMRVAASERDVTGVLKNSIKVEASPLARFVTPSVNYAAAVEEGTGPAVGRARYFPNPDNLLDFIRQSPAVRGFSLARKGSAKRGEQELDVWFRSRALALSIYMKGTKPHPFVAPTADKMRDRFFAAMDRGVESGINEVMA